MLYFLDKSNINTITYQLRNLKIRQKCV